MRHLTLLRRLCLALVVAALAVLHAPPAWAAQVITVTGHFLRSDGTTPATGRLIFELNKTLSDTNANITYTTRQKIVTLDGTGSFSIPLVSTNDPSLTPTGGTYKVTKIIDGLSESYSFVLPYNSPGLAADMSDLTQSTPGVVYGVSPQQLAAAIATAGTGFNVKSYGATGDGVTDDTTAIRAAITAAVAAGGGVVYFPRGTYIVSGANSAAQIFTITNPNLIFRGEGRKVSILKSSSAMGSGHVLFFVSATSRVLFEDLGITAANVSPSSQGIAFSGASNCEVNRVWADAQFGWSVFIGTSTRTTVRGLESAGTSSSHGLEINSSNYTLVDGGDITFTTGNGIELYDQTSMPVGNTIRGTYLHGTSPSCIQAYGTVDTLIDGVVCEGGTTAGILASGSGATSTNGGWGLKILNSAVRNTASGASGGIYITANGGSFGPADVQIEHNTIRGAAGSVPGIAVSAIGVTMSVDIALNTVSFNGGTGISVDGALAQIVSNVVTNNSQIGVGLRNGISVGAGGNTADAVVDDNQCGDTQATHTQQFGVFVGGSATNAVVSNTKAIGTTGFGVTDSGTSTVRYGNRQTAAGASPLPNVLPSMSTVLARTTLAYSASMTLNSWLANTFVITATDGVAFTLTVSNPTTGQFIDVMIRNTSGGALGVATFTGFKMAAWTQPATGNSRTIRAQYDGTNWVEVSRTPADVPN